MFNYTYNHGIQTRFTYSDFHDASHNTNGWPHRNFCSLEGPSKMDGHEAVVWIARCYPSLSLKLMNYVYAESIVWK